MTAMIQDEPSIALSPLADPVIGAIFASIEVAGLAAASLVRVVLEAEGEKLNIGKVVSVTPQRSHIDADNRSCRVDIEILTDKNERIIVEVQINPDSSIMQRNLFTASHIFVETSSTGTDSHEMVRNMPTVISINILTYKIRKDNNEVLQPFKIMYTKPPLREAISQFGGYNVQLPRLLKMEPDFSSGLYCWFYTIYTAHNENKTISEVINMVPELQEYIRKDPGFMQFCDQYELVAADPQTRSEYFIWYNNRLREAGMYQAAREEGIEIGEQIGEQRGIQIGEQIGIEKERDERRKIETNAILRLMQTGIDIATISTVYDKTVEEIELLVANQ
jgi:hypothetical protein